ncbi:GAF domain-containing SpoIIE family protein phosphatase [Nonomuraea pusilla]|uniref:Serine phosphatase RsbU, regulator of sigma subunit n=1 Tax=Nonomuraea pusilla TaxID=46177 RepID=A0A1H7TSF7_9ACTN|nr:GAF domain-containing SpoIIE family protein phosphatase [Nonomuraea pusilla]SEL87528.1 Serine phosphatase RsbU, regulator of sigma subunit [Nonomuraea pusilla]
MRERQQPWREADAQAVVRSLLEHALPALGATAVALWATGPGASLALAGYAGFSGEEADRWRHVPPGVATPAARALAERRLIRYDTAPKARLPTIGARHVGGGRVVAPALWGGRILGVLEIGWPHRLPSWPPQTERHTERQIEALAELCARTLDAGHGGRAGPAPEGVVPEPARAELAELADTLPDPALVLLPRLGPRGGLEGFVVEHANPPFADASGRHRAGLEGVSLAEAYPMAAGLAGAAEEVYATGRPARLSHPPPGPPAGRAELAVTRHGVRLLLVWRARDHAGRLPALLAHAQRLARIGAFEEDLLAGEVTWNGEMFDLYGLGPRDRPFPLDRLSDHAHPDDAPAVGGFLRTLVGRRRPAAVAFRLRRPDGAVRQVRVVAEPVPGAGGAVAGVRGVCQDVSSQHWTEVALAVTRDQLAHTERHAAERDRLALRLQRAIMPPSDDAMDSYGLHVAVRYRPAREEHLVGGDWYDAFALPSRRILLVVGDVAGHGLQAATGMVVLRNALRGLAVTGAGPARLLAWLNLLARHQADRVTATVVCGLYDPRTRELRWARAGHLPPLLLRGGGGRELPLTRGAVLGAFRDPRYEEGRLRLRPDDTLLLYTDGLIERRNGDLERARDRLLATATQPAGGLDHRLDHLLTHCGSSEDDDTCLVGVHLRPE